jgi:hypothetical protein
MVACFLPRWCIWHVEEQSLDDVENHCYCPFRRTYHCRNFEHIDGIGNWILVFGNCKLVAIPLVILKITNGNFLRFHGGIRHDKMSIR